MFRELMNSIEGESGDMTKDFCVGGTFTAGENIAAGTAVAISTVDPSLVIEAYSDDPLRRAVVGISLDTSLTGEPVRVAILGRVAAVNVTSPTVAGDPLFTSTALVGLISPTPGAGKPMAIGIALADDATGVAPVWVGSSAAS